MLTEQSIEPTYFTISEASKYMRVNPKTLANWRCKGTGPRYYKPAPRIVTYRKSDLDAYLQNRAKL
jgi:hypothetical protein